MKTETGVMCRRLGNNKVTSVQGSEEGGMAPMPTHSWKEATLVLDFWTHIYESIILATQFVFWQPQKTLQGVWV